MLNQIINVGDSTIPGIFIDTRKDLERAWKKYGNRAVYMTTQPEVLRKIKQIGGAGLYLEKAQQREGGETQDSLERNVFASGADYIWQMADETDWPDSNYLFRIWQRHMHLPWQMEETDRLIIRESVMEDLPYFQKFYEEEKDNPDVQPLTADGTDQKEVLSEERTEHSRVKQQRKLLQDYIANRYPLFEYGLWTIVDKKTGSVIGRAGIEELPENYGSLAGEPELSYLIGTSYRRKGYAEEACRAILRYAAEELKMKTVYLRTSKSNLPSQRLAENLGLLKVESITEYKDLLYCGLLTFENGKYIM